jgi:hypothetical protein
MDNDRFIPGTHPDDISQHIYFCLDKKHDSAHKQFDAIFDYTNQPAAKHGGARFGGFSLALPDDSVFYNISYHGDCDGWKRHIEKGAEILNTALAKIETDKFIVSDGRIFELSECIPNFDYNSKLS